MSETSSTPMTSIESHAITSNEASHRLDKLTILADIADDYGQVKRATIMEDGSCETDAQHVLRLALVNLGYVLAYRPDLDSGKVVIYSVIHDILEAISGDIATLTATEDIMQQKYLSDHEALQVLRRKLVSHPQIVKIVDNYENLADDEATFVKTSDKNDPSFTHMKNGGQALWLMHIHSPEVLASHDARVFQRMESYSEPHQDMMAIIAESRRRVSGIAFAHGNEQLMINFEG